MFQITEFNFSLTLAFKINLSSILNSCFYLFFISIILIFIQLQFVKSYHETKELSINHTLLSFYTFMHTRIIPKSKKPDFSRKNKNLNIRNLFLQDFYYCINKIFSTLCKSFGKSFYKMG